MENFDSNDFHNEIDGQSWADRTKKFNELDVTDRKQYLNFLADISEDEYARSFKHKEESEVKTVKRLKFMSLAIIVVMMLSLVGCKDSNPSSDASSTPTSSQLSSSQSVSPTLSQTTNPTSSSPVSPSTSPSTSVPDTSIEQPVGNSTFDIEVARKNIVLKGQPFEMPVALKDLSDGWTWEDMGAKYFDEGEGLAHLYYEDEEMVIAALENFYDADKEDGIIYNLTIETDDCSIDGITPLKSTKQDVLEKYGEPNEIGSAGHFRYGTTNNSDTFGGRINEQRLTIKFDENDNIILISITYADLTK